MELKKKGCINHFSNSSQLLIHPLLDLAICLTRENGSYIPMHEVKGKLKEKKWMDRIKEEYNLKAKNIITSTLTHDKFFRDTLQVTREESVDLKRARNHTLFNVKLLKCSNRTRQPKVTVIIKSKYLTLMNLATLFRNLWEHELELNIFVQDEDFDIRKKGVALKVDCEEIDYSSLKYLNNENLTLMIKKTYESKLPHLTKETTRGKGVRMLKRKINKEKSIHSLGGKWILTNQENHKMKKNPT
ncbi:hypothetical protein CR513_17712, partial [Mucuna pruriens]